MDMTETEGARKLNCGHACLHEGFPPKERDEVDRSRTTNNTENDIHRNKQ